MVVPVVEMVTAAERGTLLARLPVELTVAPAPVGTAVPVTVVPPVVPVVLAVDRLAPAAAVVAGTTPPRPLVAVTAGTGPVAARQGPDLELRSVSRLTESHRSPTRRPIC